MNFIEIGTLLLLWCAQIVSVLEETTQNRQIHKITLPNNLLQFHIHRHLLIDNISRRQPNYVISLLFYCVCVVIGCY